MEPITVHDVLSRDECEALIGHTEGIGFDDAPITTSIGFLMRPEIRNNTRVMLDDRRRARSLWAKVAAWLPAQYGDGEAVGLNERFRFYRYQPGQYFQWHRDGAFHRSETERSRLTLMVYLNDGYEGGRTEIHGFPEIEPRRGMMLAFPHGWLHRGAPVEQGTKYVMRTDVMYRTSAAARSA